MLAGRKAIARGIYQGVAQLADRTYWKNKGLGIVEAIKFIGSTLTESAWVDNWENDYRAAAVTGNQKACDLLLERFEKHEFQPLSAAEQEIRQTCIQLQTLSWDQLVEHGAQLATSLALDCLALKAGEFALSPAGRAFMNDITEVFKLPPPHAQEYMIEFAGIGKIALEEGVSDAIRLINKRPATMSNMSQKAIPQTSKNLLQVSPKNGAQNSMPASVAQISTTAPVNQNLFAQLKLIGNNIWESPGGLVYGPDKKFGNHLQHVLAHTTPNL